MSLAEATGQRSSAIRRARGDGGGVPSWVRKPGPPPAAVGRQFSEPAPWPSSAASACSAPRSARRPFPSVVEPVSVDSTGTLPVGTDHSSPALSDTGAVVAFDATDAANPSAPPRVWIRDRTAGTTTPVADLVSAAPGMSGNGCLVAYSVPGGSNAAPTVSLTVVDRCATSSGEALPAGTVVDTVPAVPTSPPPAAPVDEYAAPALSFDGSTIVWSTGSEIRRYVRPAVVRRRGGRRPCARRLVRRRVGAQRRDDGRRRGHLRRRDDGRLRGRAGHDTVRARPRQRVRVEPAPPPRPTRRSNCCRGRRREHRVQHRRGRRRMSADGSLVVFDSTSTDLAAIGTADHGPIGRRSSSSSIASAEGHVSWSMTPIGRQCRATVGTWPTNAPAPSGCCRRPMGHRSRRPPIGKSTGSVLPTRSPDRCSPASDAGSCSTAPREP